MRAIKLKLYQFDELSEEAKQKAIESISDINVYYDWWRFIYDDAENIGIKITGFDIDRFECSIEVQSSCMEVADQIIQDHGETCDTHKIAKQFVKDWSELVSKYSGEDTERVDEDKEAEFDEDADYLEGEFIKDLSGEYLSMLRNEYEYMTSEEAIIESIQANEYEFTEDGELN